MEIFCRNIPEHVTKNHLQKSFTPILLEFGVHTFHCEKLSRGFATLTLLDAVQAQKLLDRYGQSQTGPRRQPHHLKLFNKPTYLSKSRNPPDELMLRCLEEEEHDRSRRIPRTLVPKAGQAQNTFAIRSLSCGIWDYEGNEPVFFSFYTHARNGLLVFGKSLLTVEIESMLGPLSTLRLEFDYSSIVSQMYTTNSPKPSITLSMVVAPRLYEEQHNTGLFVDAKMKRLLTSRIACLGRDDANVSATCFTYQLVLQQPADLRLMQAFKKERRVPRMISWRTSTIDSQIPYHKQMDAFYTSLIAETLPYRVKYQLQMLVWNGILSSTKVVELFPEAHRLIERVGINRASQTVQRFAKKVPFAGPEADKSDFDAKSLMKIMSSVGESVAHDGPYATSISTSPNGTWIHRATVTPLGIYLFGPYWEPMNRILRSHAGHAEYFMRVEFLEETGDPMRFDQNASLDHIFEHRFKAVLHNGFIISGRHFEFLGFSHSSLRSQSCWFIAAFSTEYGQSIDARTIIGTLGDFSHIASPAKCAARIGQALSDTVPSIEIPEHVIEKVDDVQRGNRMFSDGVGTVSTSLIHKIWEKYAVQGKLKPTVIQIRFAGAKGMIGLDSTRRGDVLMLRKSMIKFEASESWRNIEICGSGIRPLPLHLNRQFIKIMEDLGVPVQPFFDLQQSQVDDLRAAARSPMLAANFLEKANLPPSARIPWLIRFIVRLGLDFLGDDFLRHMIELAVLVKLRELKYRARIHVERGFTLHGIMDETGFLKEGEIYCPTVNDDTGMREVLHGRNVVITRAPALHPGDIQLVNAVDVPDDSPLNDLHNCVVFSQHGARDLPSKLSGGDLDGDLYNVIYDNRLRPKPYRIAQPADYPLVTALSLDRPVERSDIIDHFVTFMQQDQLGRIATLHQAIADQKPMGTFDPECLLLAELHSTAVDYSKSGRPANIKLLPPNKRFRPDFMAPGPRIKIEDGIELDAIDRPSELFEEGENQYRYYRSHKALGQLYRAIDEQKFLQELRSTTQATRGKAPDVVDKLWAYALRESTGFQWRHHTEVAEEIKEVYEENLLELMYQYSPTPWVSTITETEVFIGNIVGNTHGQSKRQREASMAMRSEYERLLEATTSWIGNKDAGREEALERSIACFAIAVEEGPVARYHSDRSGKDKLFSFRWIAAGVCLQEIERLKKTIAF